MDPYDYEKARLEYEGIQQAKPAIMRIRAKWQHLHETVHAPLSNKERGAWRDVGKSKSSAIAQFVREHGPVPKPVKAGLGVFALFALVAGIVWRRRKRS